jgi:protein-tyrosine phosphatase
VIHSHDLGLASTPNFRVVGGQPTLGRGRVRTGLLYRSSALSHLDGADAVAFARLGIRSVYDLRTEAERQAEPDVLPAETACVGLDVLGDAPGITPAEVMALIADPRAAEAALGGGRANASFEQTYREFVTLPSARAAYGRVFHDVARPEHRPALIHCSGGKDRTGWAAAALLLLLGVPDEVVLEDYLASRACLEPMARRVLGDFRARGGDPEVLRPFVDVREEHLAAAVEEMRRSFGDVEGYFAEGLAIDTATQRELRDTFVAPT